eukprot:9178123-Lingulodinium_polyedra.AAC.1
MGAGGSACTASAVALSAKSMGPSSTLRLRRYCWINDWSAPSPGKPNAPSNWRGAPRPLAHER